MCLAQTFLNGGSGSIFRIDLSRSRSAIIGQPRKRNIGISFITMMLCQRLIGPRKIPRRVSQKALARACGAVLLGGVMKWVDGLPDAIGR